jgi:hypothetical protein
MDYSNVAPTAIVPFVSGYHFTEYRIVNVYSGPINNTPRIVVRLREVGDARERYTRIHLGALSPQT